MSSFSTPRSARSRPVPFLPGHSSTGFKPNHHKTQSLVYAPSGPIVSPRWDMPKLDMSVLEKLKDPNHRYNYSARSLTHDEREAIRDSARNTYQPALPPTWMKHDRQVLRFSAYFKEPVHEHPKENFRVRQCIIYYYLDDGTLMVSEPKIENSGIHQGTFVKRHRVPKADGGHFKPEDLQCGKTIEIYSRAFRVVDCDPFTENFYNEVLGMDVGNKESIPLDSWRNQQLMEGPAGIPTRTMTRDIKEGKEFVELFLGGGRKNVKLQQFLDNDRKVLSFKCYWDDHTHYGERLYFELHYYLSDDSVEILESLPINSGRDPYPTFWKKGPLPKNPYFVAVPGLLAPDPDNYKPEDLLVGNTVDVFGRKVFLYDCDDFTRDFYQRYLNHEQEAIKLEKVKYVHPQLGYPPHTGFGSEEDSLANCLRLEPRPPRRDEVRLMEQAHSILRFQAKILDPQPEDVARRFIFVIYIADDSVAVWETRQRNSGRTEGRFSMRGRKMDPVKGTWYKVSDFFVGAVVEVSATPFLLCAAEPATLKYMEDHSGEFAFSSAKVISAKLKPMQEELRNVDSFPAEDLRSRARDLCGVYLTDHEMLTLLRKCGDSPSSISSGLLLACMGA